MIKKLISALKPKPKRYRYRSSVTGKMVSQAYAAAHPDPTVRERVDG